MNILLRLGGALVGLAACAAPGFATPKDYCQAYARDFADSGPRDEKTWTNRHDNALADCLFQYQPTRAETQKTLPRAGARQAAKPVAKPKPVAEPDTDVAEPLPEPAVIVAPDIEPPQKATATTAKPAKKTLLSKFFPRKVAAAPADEPGKLAHGSAAWLDYCDNKYASFNRETGTYKSYKGVERKCLVTD